ncbi:MAG: acyltransferase domain-containing protein [Desulfovibrio sp.]|nr:acyltransferase domain-containing protein [Desulfovibrio sp.]
MKQYPEPGAPAGELTLDGVHYALLTHKGQEWRMASLNPLWREELGALPQRPSRTVLDSLRDKGVWLSPIKKTPPLALACCGLGAAWPGMGLELYANFPVAREAIEELASYAQWDVLSFLAETDQDKINNLRWQIPYLFLLEYAQWRQLSSLGLRPALVCGHSIGELVALCVAGVYDARSAWYLFDTRAEHIAELEARSGRATGMLAVSADLAVLEEILAAHPAIKVANANTPGQFVLGGPRSELLTIRKNLRKRRVVAFMLPMGMAFHNPAMATLRDLSYRRLLALDIRPPQIPAVSCVDGVRYPADKEAIAGFITRLDENTVDWVGCVDTVRREWNIRDWIELGPQEILRGLIVENAPDSECAAADRKGREAVSMRELCCRLFIDGHLSWEHILREKISRREDDSPAAEISSPSPPPALTLLDEEGETILALISETSGRPLTAGDLHLDLRRDLALRSSVFPRLVQEAENRLGRTISLENLPQISTVGDLIKFLSGKTPAENRPSAPGPAVMEKHLLVRRRLENGGLAPAPLNPAKSRAKLSPDSLVCVFAEDPESYPDFWSALGASGCRIAAPWLRTDLCGKLSGAPILSLDCDPDSPPDEVFSALTNFSAERGLFDAVFILPRKRPFKSEDNGASAGKIPENAAGIAPVAAKFLKDDGPLISLRPLAVRSDETPSAEELSRFFGPGSPKTREILWLVPEPSDRAIRYDADDLLLLEYFFGSGDRIVWEAPGLNPAPRFCPASPVYADIFPAMDPEGGVWERQFSLFSSPDLAGHGGGFSPFVDASFASRPWIPPGMAVSELLLAASNANPWLVPFALSDVRIRTLPALPPGVTRICRFKCENRFWLRQDGPLALLCDVVSSVEKISKNGRASGEYERTAEGLALLATASLQPRPLWNPEDFGSGADGQTIDLAPLYDLLKLSPVNRLLLSLKAIGGERGRYAAKLVPTDRVAGTPDWRYKKTGLLIDAAIQAALAALLESCWPLEKGRPRLAIGFVRLDFAELEPGGESRLTLASSWREESLARFDAQILDARDRLVLTINHLEFDANSRSGGDGFAVPADAGTGESNDP